MKSRQDFQSEQEWFEYLRYYYAGVALPYMIDKYKGIDNFINSAHWAIEAADELIKQLKQQD